MKKIMVVGANSEIVKQIVNVYASSGAKVFLMGRDQKKLDVISSDLNTKYNTETESLAFDFMDFDKHQTAFEKGIEFLGELDLFLIGHGTLPDQEKAQTDFSLAKREIDLNFLTYVSFLTTASNHMARQRSGTIAAISSVAGDRGRKSNYVYGSAKAALSTYLAGLRGRMLEHGVGVLTVKPGFVSTPMTSHLEQGPLYATSTSVAKSIAKAIDSGKDEIYVPFFWRFIMMIIKSIPEKIFKKMNI
jgi:short-subunit dehydrogenase